MLLSVNNITKKGYILAMYRYVAFLIINIYWSIIIAPLTQLALTYSA